MSAASAGSDGPAGRAVPGPERGGAPTTNANAIALAAGGTDVWVISLRPPQARSSEDLEGRAPRWSELAREERERATRFLRPADGERWAQCRAAVRRVLARYCGFAPDGLRFGYGEHGKPFLDHPSASAIRFNVSHCGALAVCAVTEGVEVGVDLEELRPRRGAVEVARTFFSSRESARLDGLEGAARLETFYRLWTAKEAYLKALGAGLDERLERVEPDLDAAGDELRFASSEGASAERLDGCYLWPREGYLAALVRRGGLESVRLIEER